MIEVVVALLMIVNGEIKEHQNTRVYVEMFKRKKDCNAF